MIVSALIFFEMFNYSTTDYALRDLLGGLTFLGLPWATILAVAFCGIDFAGVARLFTPQSGVAESRETWYLLGAWLLAATMNALLTWWGVSMAITNHTLQSTAVVSATTLTQVVPVFVALMVWVIRILIIGTISQAGERIFSSQARQTYSRPAAASQAERPAYNGVQRPVPSIAQRPASAAMPRSSAPLASTRNQTDLAGRPEPTYHSLSAAPRPLPPRPGSNENRRF
jgi:hypothetical protein